MNNGLHERVYSPDECVVFRKTKELYGGLSNMASGFPLRINGTRIWSSEALYQACRFPLRTDIQEVILAERSPMTAKMKSKHFRELSRPDWESVKIKVMRWCLRVKLAQNWDRFGQLLLSTDQKPIVEESHKDVFWGAKRLENGTLVGVNVLGRFLMELRQELMSSTSEHLKSVAVPDIADFLLLGQAIPTIEAGSAVPEESVTSTRKAMFPEPSEAVVSLGQSRTAVSGASVSSGSLWPKSTEADLVGNAGMHLVGLKVASELHYIFRPKLISDLGIDAEIEVRKDDESKGRLVAVQVKAGGSYLKEQTQTGVVYRGTMAHLRYWLNYSVPVVVIVCDLTSSACWWQLVDLEKIQFHKASWSMEIPFAQRLDSSAIDPLRKISSRFQKRDIIDLLFRSWLLESHYYELTLASILEQPRDYQWVRFLGRRATQDVMADYVMADLKKFDLAEIDEMIRWAESNHRQFAYEKLILGMISETKEAFPIGYRPTVTEQGLAVELVPLLLKLDDGPVICEVGAGGRLITSYFDHRAWDDWAQEVSQQRMEISASALA